MPPLEENFCKGIVAGLNKKAAWEAAGYVADSPKAEAESVSRLMRLPEVQFRIRYLRIRQSVRLNITIDKLVLELQDAWETASRDSNPTAMIAATLAKAKLLGYLDEDRGRDSRLLPKPSPIPTDVVELSESEWIAQFKPKTIQ